MSKMLVLYGKHGNDYYDISTDSLKYGASLDILMNNLKMYYFEDEDKEKAEKILSDEDGKAAFRFIMQRTNYEYERVEIETLVKKESN